MVASFSCTPDTLSRRNPFQSSTNDDSKSHTRRFGSRDALFLLHNCSDFKQLKRIHARIIRSGLSHDQVIVVKLLRSCSSIGEMEYATSVFDQLPRPPTMVWNLMIQFHVVNGSPRQALVLFGLMICRGVLPDKFTFPFAMKACLALASPLFGREVITLAVKCGFSRDIFLQNTLMDLFFKCGNSEHGGKVFDKMRVRNVVSWTTMISGLVACGELDAARWMFEQMPKRNVVSWTAIINGYARNQRPNEAFELFRRMLQVDNVKPNEYTLVSLLIACTELGSLNLGRRIHDFAVKNGFDLGVFLGTALIDMYSKCGSLEDAKRVFDSMDVKSTATWNSMITSLGVHGRGEEALNLFEKMEAANVEPDAVTFVGVLCACVRTKNVTGARRYFRRMTERYGISPNAEHYSCMVELCSHANIPEFATHAAKVGRTLGWFSDNKTDALNHHNDIFTTNTWMQTFIW